MEDWEDAILIRQESEADECATCPHKGEKCRNQCMEIKDTSELISSIGGQHEDR